MRTYLLNGVHKLSIAADMADVIRRGLQQNMVEEELKKRVHESTMVCGYIILFFASTSIRHA